jgi:nucleoside 2-deoxyribosyltransferase
MKLYLAGPDVFLPDAVEIGNKKRRLCARFGHTGLFPLDNEIVAGFGGSLPKAIFDGNIGMIRQADAVVANLTPFRGISADAGTVFEIGYARGINKPVYGYANVRAPYLDRVQQFLGGAVTQGDDGRLFGADGLAIENFGKYDNLMIIEALNADLVLPEVDPDDRWRDLATFERCLRMLKQRAGRHREGVIEAS